MEKSFLLDIRTLLVIHAIYAFQTNVNIHGTSIFSKNTLINDFVDGTLAVECSTLEFTGNFSFENNKIQDLNKNGGGIYATLECTVILSGNGSFINNMAKYGGGIYLDQMSVIKILPQTTLQFERNKAAKGAAIFIQTSSTQVNCSSLPC